MRICLVSLMRCFAGKGTVRNIQVAFLHPDFIQMVQFIQRLWLRNGRFPEERIHGLVIALLFAFPFRIIGSGIQEADPEFSAGPLHPVRAELFPIIEIHTIGCPVFQECFPETILYDRLVERCVELGMQDVPGTVIQETDHVGRLPIDVDAVLDV